MGEHINHHDDEVKQQCADGEPEKVFDEGAGVFAGTTEDEQMFEKGDDGKVKHDAGHDGGEILG